MFFNGNYHELYIKSPFNNYIKINRLIVIIE